jgi:hypothetical protein
MPKIPGFAGTRREDFGGEEKGHCHSDPRHLGHKLRLAGAGKMGKAYKIGKLKKEKN